MSAPIYPGSDKLPRKSFASEPVHLRLTDLCREAIKEGDFAPGDRFPSERELAERYEVSRSTANKVISALVAEGWLELQKGIGSRVRKRRTLFASLGGMESFTAHAREQGLEPRTSVLAFTHCLSTVAPDTVRAGLQLDLVIPEPLIYLERLRLADGIPMILESRWVRESLAQGLSRHDVEESFYRILEEKFGLQMTGEHHSLSAVLVDDEAATLFETTPPFPALRVEGTGFVKNGIPLWYQRLLYRGDRYQLHHETRGIASSAIELRLQKTQLSA